MAGEAVEELAGLDGPDVDVERVERTGAYDLTRCVHRETGELDARGRSEGFEVAVTHEIPGSHGTIKGGGEEEVLCGELSGSHAGGVLGEGNDTESGLSVPDLDLAVVGGSNDTRTIGGIRECVHAVEMSLLLDNIRL